VPLRFDGLIGRLSSNPRDGSGAVRDQNNSANDEKNSQPVRKPEPLSKKGGRKDGQ
jgi:hypothetical protein